MNMFYFCPPLVFSDMIQNSKQDGVGDKQEVKKVSLYFISLNSIYSILPMS